MVTWTSLNYPVFPAFTRQEGEGCDLKKPAGYHLVWRMLPAIGIKETQAGN